MNGDFIFVNFKLGIVFEVKDLVIVILLFR